MAKKYRSISYADFLPRVTSANYDKNYTMKIQAEEVVLLLSIQVCNNIEWKSQYRRLGKSMFRRRQGIVVIQLYNRALKIEMRAIHTILK